MSASTRKLIAMLAGLAIFGAATVMVVESLTRAYHANVARELHRQLAPQTIAVRESLARSAYGRRDDRRTTQPPTDWPAHDAVPWAVALQLPGVTIDLMTGRTVAEDTPLWRGVDAFWQIAVAAFGDAPVDVETLHIGARRVELATGCVSVAEGAVIPGDAPRDFWAQVENAWTLTPFAERETL